MKKCYVLALIVGLFLSAPAHAWTHGSSCLSIDANGWTVYPASHTAGSSATGKTYYVSNNDGNNGTAVANDVTKPWKTVAAAATQLKTDAGSPNVTTTDSWLLLKRGDIFTDQVIGGTFNGYKGISCLHPFVISSYDPSQPGVPDPYGNFTVASITCASTTVTVTTTAPHGWTNGNPYYVVLTKELPAGFNGEFAATITGTTTLTYPVASCPAASDTLHGIITLARPILAPNIATQSSCGPSDGGNGSDFLIFSGVECYGYTLDPANPSYSKAGYANTLGVATIQTPLTWMRVENVFSRYTFYAGITANPALQGTTFEKRRSISYLAAGDYMQGWLNYTAYQNFNLYDGWNPNLAAGFSVSVATGTPGIITWVNNPLVSGSTCSKIKFTGGTLPSGIVAGTLYSVVGLSGDTFKVDTTCAGTGITLGGSPSAVLGYWQGGNAAGFPGLFPQAGDCTGGCVHSYYLQNGANSPYEIRNILFSGNVAAFTAGDAVQGGGYNYENLLFQNWSPLAIGKFGENTNTNNYTASYNGIFEVAQLFNFPTISPISTVGAVFGIRLGVGTMDHNLVAYEKGASGFSTGLSPTTLNSDNATSVVTNNIACGLTSPIAQDQGVPSSYTISNAGSGYTEVSGSNTYSSPFSPIGQGGIQATGGSGHGLGIYVTINGTTGVVTGVAYQYNMNGFGYVVGDVISSANTYLGGAGSGWSARVATINSYGGAVTFDTIVGGSGYSIGELSNMSGGSGRTGILSIVVPGPHGCGSSCSIQAAYPYTGTLGGYTVGNTLTLTGISPAPSVAATLNVATVINNTISGNTYKAANCNSLDSATTGGWPTSCTNGVNCTEPNSVAPPLTPSATPPTDVIGEYFQSLAYGYQATVPTVLVGQSSGYEQGYIDQARLQQKANWDINMMAHAVLGWTRPQFGMANPP